jgi:Ran-binding protein 9/10
VGIGFCTKNFLLTRLPGWEPESWGYHGDDGQVFNATQHGKAYGPKYGSGDIIGCGINFRTGTAFFTRNGNSLSTASRDFPSDGLYPTVGMKRQAEHIKINFGQAPFIFDIKSCYEAERHAVTDDIMKADVSGLCPPYAEDHLVQLLISQYLGHDGFVESGNLFAEEANKEYAALESANPGGGRLKRLYPDDDVDAVNRQRKFFSHCLIRVAF